MTRAEVELLATLSQVSFYAYVNHGTKSRDYGEVVDPVLKKYGLPTGELLNAKQITAKVRP